MFIVGPSFFCRKHVSDAFLVAAAMIAPMITYCEQHGTRYLLNWLLRAALEEGPMAHTYFSLAQVFFVLV